MFTSASVLSVDFVNVLLLLLLMFWSPQPAHECRHQWPSTMIIISMYHSELLQRAVAVRLLRIRHIIRGVDIPEAVRVGLLLPRRLGRLCRVSPPVHRDLLCGLDLYHCLLKHLEAPQHRSRGVLPVELPRR